MRLESDEEIQHWFEAFVFDLEIAAKEEQCVELIAPRERRKIK